MATIERRTSHGQTVYYAKVRRKSFAPESATFHKLSDAKRWAQTTEAAQSDHTTLAHWQLTQARSVGVLGSASVRISCGLMSVRISSGGTDGREDFMSAPPLAGFRFRFAAAEEQGV